MACINKERKTDICSAVVIGGANLDIGGSPAGRLVLHDSNPGTVSVRSGGVGRNIAGDMSLLGMRVSLITALGDDELSGIIRDSCEKLNIDLSLAVICPGMRSSVYLYVSDDTGDMHTGISDMDIISRITPEYLSGIKDRINSFDCAVIDGNLSKESIAFLAENCRIPIFADTVSSVKALRLVPALPFLTAVKPNAIEAEAMTGLSDPRAAAAELLRLGAGRVFVSMGDRGFIAADRDGVIHVPSEQAEPVNATGAGDAATAAMVFGCMHGYSLEETARLAAKAGALTVGCEETNCPELAGIINSI